MKTRLPPIHGVTARSKNIKRRSNGMGRMGRTRFMDRVMATRAVIKAT
jgi:hypothetical protein